MRVAPLHRRQRADFLRRQALMPRDLREKGTLIVGLIHTLLVQHEVLPAITVLLLVISILLTHFHRDFYLLFATIAVVELTPLRVAILALELFIIIVFSIPAEIVLADQKPQIIEDGHIDGYDLLQLGLLAALGLCDFVLGILIGIAVWKEPHGFIIILAC